MSPSQQFFGHFGSSVAVSGTTVVIGAPGQSIGGRGRRWVESMSSLRRAAPQPLSRAPTHNPPGTPASQAPSVGRPSSWVPRPRLLRRRRQVAPTSSVLRQQAQQPLGSYTNGNSLGGGNTEIHNRCRGPGAARTLETPVAEESNEWQHSFSLAAR